MKRETKKLYYDYLTENFYKNFEGEEIINFFIDVVYTLL